MNKNIDSEHSEHSEQKLVSKKQIAQRYGISLRTVQCWMEDGKLPYYKMGYIVRFHVQSCDEAMARFKVDPSDTKFGNRVPM